jgi:hypothetical protein
MGHGVPPSRSVDGGPALTIDEGTSARTEVPTPDVVGLDARHGAPTPTPADLAARVVTYARQRRGSRTGDGECFALADQALTEAGAKSAADFGTVTPTADYVWGTAVTLGDLQPGDVIQFRDYQYERRVDTTAADGTGSWKTDSQARPHHTAIVESVGRGGAVTVLEQNAPKGAAVARTLLFFADRTLDDGGTTTTIRVQGRFFFYRAQPR